MGYSTRDSAPLLDLTSGGEVDPVPFWDPVFREEGDRLALSPKRFYLLMSHEAVSIPPNLAAEMTAYDPTSGELRTHYAGFFDPGFGFDPGGGFRGSRAALEVRAHDVPFMVENGQAVCKLTFERMLEEPTALYGSGIGSSYQQQEETLSRYFRRVTGVARFPVNKTRALTVRQITRITIDGPSKSCGSQLFGDRAPAHGSLGVRLSAHGRIQRA